jgi:flagellar hook-associated protein 1 FlgK
LEITGKNLANLNNPAYARQRLIQGQIGHYNTGVGFEGLGVEGTGIQQVRDPLLDRQVQREVTKLEGLKMKQTLLTRAETALGHQINRSSSSGFVDDLNQSSSGGVNLALSDFFNAFQSFASKPTDVGQRQILLSRAETLVSRINDADERLAQVQTDAVDQIDQDLAAANEILNRIADINYQIGVAENGKPGTAVDLRDERLAKLEELAKFTEFEVREQPDGPGQLQIIAKDTGGKEVLLVDGKETSGPLDYNPTTGQFNSGGAVLRLRQGRLIAAKEAADGPVQDSRDALTALANQLTQSVNAAYNPDGTGVNFFDSPPGSGLISFNNAGVDVVSLRSGASGDAGANDIARAVGSLSTVVFRKQATDLTVTGDGSSNRVSVPSTAGLHVGQAYNGGGFSGVIVSVDDSTHLTLSGAPVGGSVTINFAADGIEGTFAGHVARTVSSLGASLASVNTQVEDQGVSERMVREQRDSVSGVSQDEELADMMRFQRAFQASARYVNVVDELLDLVVNRLGA